MKNIFAIFALGLLLSTAAQAQTRTAPDTTELPEVTRTVIKPGILFAPQGVINFGKSKEGFSTSLPVFGTVAITIDGIVTLTPFYNFSNNATGLAFEYAINDRVGMYGVFSKTVIFPKESFSSEYVGIGIDRAVANNAAFAFMKSVSILVQETISVQLVHLSH